MELTFKGRSSEFGNFYAKTENNLTIPINEYNQTVNFLVSLGYQSYVVVKKYRDIYSIREDNIHYNIMIDDIEDIGAFVEIEVLGKKGIHDMARLTKELNKLVTKFNHINLENANMPYRDFVAKEMYNKIKIPSGLKALLIDLDGTLISSERFFFEAYKGVLCDDYGINISYEDYETHEMAQNNNLISYLKQNDKLHIDISEPEIMQKIYIRYETEFSNLIGDSETLLNFELLKMLKSQTHIKLALVTTSKEHFVNILLDRLDIRNLFDIVITRESVKNLKPAPDAYLNAIKLLQLTETEALVLEDSERGIQAARNASLSVVGLNKNKEKCAKEYYLDTFARFALIFMNHFETNRWASAAND
jgi:putative hydrolase of the HAD superfamily